MKRSVLLAVGLASLFLGHGGYAEKTKVDPTNVKLHGDHIGSLSLVGVQSDGQLIVSGTFNVIDGWVRKNFARITAYGQLDTSWGNFTAYSSLVMDGDDVYAAWVDNTGNKNVTRLDANGAVGTNWVYTTTNSLSLAGINGAGLFMMERHSLKKFNKQTGAADWSYTYTNYAEAYISLSDNTNIYIIESQWLTDCAIDKLDEATGALVWSTNIGVAAIGNVASDGASLYYTAGAFLMPYYISRINIETGVIDANWLCGRNGRGSIDSLAVDDTGVYAGGAFTQICGVARSGLAKIDKNTGLVISNWDIGVSGLSVTAFQIDENSIYAIGSAGVNCLAKIDKITAAIDWVIPINDLNPVNIAIIGSSIFVTAVNSDSMTYFAKIDKLTGVMLAFLGEHSCYDKQGTASCLVRQFDGKIYLGGDFIGVNGIAHSGLVRLSTDGSVDNWKHDLIADVDDWRNYEKVKALAVDDTGLYLAYNYSTYYCASMYSISHGVIRKISKSAGAAVTKWQFNAGNYTWANAIAVDAEYVYAGGSGDGSNVFSIAKLNKTTGKMDSRWNSAMSVSDSRASVIDALALDGDSLYVGGIFSEIGGCRHNHLAKLDKFSGKADARWNAEWSYNSSLGINELAVDGDSVYVGGCTDRYSRKHGGLAKLDKTTGRADPAWRCVVDGAVNSIVIDGGWLYVGGGFHAINGAMRSHVARLNKTTGAVDPTWIHNTDGDVASLLVAKGVCYIGGSFTRIGLQDHFGFGAILPEIDSTSGDYDGDRIADFALCNPSSGQWQIKLSSVKNAPCNFTMTSGSSWIPVRGDFDGDGRTDPSLYSPDLGRFIVKASVYDYREYSVSLGGPDWIPVPGDYDDDGITDFMVYLPSHGLWVGLLSSIGFMNVTLPSVGGSDWAPVAGDFNGDGCCDPAVYNMVTGQWRMLDSSRNYQEIDLALTFGGTGFQAMAGDFDGDGLSDFAVYSAILGEWDIALSSLGYAKVSVTCGGEGYVPIPGDYDGDGIIDIGVYSATQGQGIALISSSNRKPVSCALGGSGYRPCNP